MFIQFLSLRFFFVLKTVRLASWIFFVSLQSGQGARQLFSFFFRLRTDHISVYAFNMFRYLVFMFPNELLVWLACTRLSTARRFFCFYSPLWQKGFSFSSTDLLFSLVSSWGTFMQIRRDSFYFFFRCHERNFVNCFNLFLNGAS